MSRRLRRGCLARRAADRAAQAASTCCRSSSTPIERRYFNLLEDQPHRVHTRLDSHEVQRHDLRRQPSHHLPLLNARGAVPAHRAHVAARRRPAARARATRCSSSRRRRSAPSARTTTATASSCSTSSRTHKELVVHARSTITVTAPPSIDLGATAPWEQLAGMIADPRAGLDLRRRRAMPAHRSTRARPPTSPTTRARRSRPAGRSSRRLDLVERIYDDFMFDPTATDISTPVTQVLRAAPRRLPGFRASGARLPARACACRRATSAATS